MDIAKSLAEAPDEIVVFEDGQTVTAAIKKLREDKRTLEKSSTKTVTFTHHATHWIIATVFTPRGTSAATNHLVCLPKSKYSETDALKHVDEYTKEVLPFDGE